MRETKRLAIGLALSILLGPAMLLLGQTTSKATKADQGRYRALTRADGLTCGARVAEMGFTFSGAPSGTLTGFECLNKEGETISIDLKSKEFVDGKIETQNFGIIIMKQTNGMAANYEMTASQITKLKTFLGFSGRPSIPAKK